MRADRGTQWAGRPARAVIAAIVVAGFAGAGVQGMPSSSAVAAPAVQTVVSLTFDDGTSDQRIAAPIMQELGMRGTFFVPSGFIGSPGYLTRDDLSRLAAAGHEIGGHTVLHPDLGTLPGEELRRQICNDRATLLGWGFQVSSFAYPFAVSTPEAEAVVKECGYNSGRMLGDIRSRFGCEECYYAAVIPPRDPYYTEAYDMVDSTWTIDDLKNAVVNAENAVIDEEKVPGWLQLTFHDFCIVECSSTATPLSMFTEFLRWLQPRATTNNTVVKTVAEVIGGPVQPAVVEPLPNPPAPGANGIVNPGLEELGGTGLPYCWGPATYGDLEADFTLSPGRTGAVASALTVSRHKEGDAKLVPQLDLGACAPTVIPGHRYFLHTWYTSTTVTQYSVYLRNSQGVWDYWLSSPWYEASSDWASAEWVLPPIPEGSTGISFGLALFENGSLTTDDYRLYDVTVVEP